MITVAWLCSGVGSILRKIEFEIKMKRKWKWSLKQQDSNDLGEGFLTAPIQSALGFDRFELHSDP
jgi:hypothetical protein